MKKQPLVTRESLKLMLDNANLAKKQEIIGRALVALLNRQTADEQASAVTNNHNSMGFAQCDAFTGTKCAKYFRDTGRLEGWMIGVWLKRQANGFPRIAKYHKQLNEVAEAKAKVNTEQLQIAQAA